MEPISAPHMIQTSPVLASPCRSSRSPSGRSQVPLTSPDPSMSESPPWPPPGVKGRRSPQVHPGPPVDPPVPCLPTVLLPLEVPRLPTVLLPPEVPRLPTVLLPLEAPPLPPGLPPLLPPVLLPLEALHPTERHLLEVILMLTGPLLLTVPPPLEVPLLHMAPLNLEEPRLPGRRHQKATLMLTGPLLPMAPLPPTMHLPPTPVPQPRTRAMEQPMVPPLSPTKPRPLRLPNESLTPCST